MFGFGDAWVSLAFLVWLAIIGRRLGRDAPRRAEVAAGDLSVEKKVAMGGQLVTVLTLVMLYLMIWKPGA